MHRWGTAHEPRPFDVEDWLRTRTPEEFDDATIGLLATPPPALDELAQALREEYQFLRGLAPEEEALAACNGRDRTLLLRQLASLPGTQLPQGSCW